MRRFSVLTVLLIGILVLGAGRAAAVTNGGPDGTRHPYTAVLVADYITPGYFQRFCSGTLVAPTLVVTAAHCALSKVDPEVWVSFDSVYRPGISPIIHGTMYAAVDPADIHGESGFGAARDDIAVIHLDQAVNDIAPAHLPAAGLLSALDLRSQTFTAVGYGRTRIDKTRGKNAIVANFDPDVRNYASMSFLSLQERMITYQANPATGDGGGCFGDSGSATFLGDTDIMVSIVSTGDAVCRAMGRDYRLDQPSARAFLASHGVPLP